MAPQNEPQLRKLTKKEKSVIIHKSTETPFTAKTSHHGKKAHTSASDAVTHYTAQKTSLKQMANGQASMKKFPAQSKECQTPWWATHRNSMRKMWAHLWHVFIGKGFTTKDTRHYVNSISMEFIPDKKQK